MLGYSGYVCQEWNGLGSENPVCLCGVLLDDGATCSELKTGFTASMCF